MTIRETLADAFTSPFNTALGLSSWVGTATGIGIRLNQATPPFRIFEETCQAGLFSVLNTATMPLRHGIGTITVLVLTGVAYEREFDAPAGWKASLKSGASALAYFAAPTLASLSGYVPASLTNDLVRQCIYGIGLEHAVEALKDVTSERLAGRVLTFSTLVFGLWNVTFFAHKVAECVDVQTAWLEMLAAVVVTAGSVLVERSITYLGSAPPKGDEHKD